MTVIEEIKELEKQAKRAEHYKEMYNNIFSDVEKISNELSLVQAKLSALTGKSVEIKKKSPSKYKENITDSYRKVGDALYEQIKIDDSKQIGTPDIEKALSKAGLSPNAPNVVMVRNYIATLDNVHKRKDGNKVFFYYHKTQEKEMIVETGLPKKFSYGA